MSIDDEQGSLSTGRARDHVLEELDVAGSVNDDVIAFCRLEKTSGGIDGDALGLFVLQCVQQKGILERARALAARCLYLLKLAFRQRMRVGHQAADDGALAMVHMADQDDVHLLARGGCSQRWLTQ